MLPIPKLYSITKPPKHLYLPIASISVRTCTPLVEDTIVDFVVLSVEEKRGIETNGAVWDMAR